MEWFWIVVGLVFVAFMMAVACACCCVDLEDTFNRSNSTNIGPDWTEEAGSWEINGNSLRVSSTTVFLFS